MAKKVTGFISLQIPAGQANPSPPVGPALGQQGVNIMEFCKAFNAQSQDQKPGTPLPVKIKVFQDRSFEFVIKTPPASYFLKQAAGVKKGSGTPNTNKVGQVTWKQCIEIGKQKMPDLNCFDEEKAASMIAGSAKAMGLEVIGAPDGI